MRLVQELLEMGFKPHRHDKTMSLVPTRDLTTFSSVIPGGTQITFLKGDKRVDIGLGEPGLPPTLLSPVNRLEYKMANGMIMSKPKPQFHIEREIQRLGLKEYLKNNW